MNCAFDMVVKLSEFAEEEEKTHDGPQGEAYLPRYIAYDEATKLGHGPDIALNTQKNQARSKDGCTVQSYF